MQTCPGCHRHVRVDESRCPFCTTALRSKAAPSPRGLAAMVLAVGLALVGCTEDEASEDDETDSMMTMDAGMTSTTMDEGMTSTTTDAGSTTSDDSVSSTETYAGPAPDDWSTDTADDSEATMDTTESTETDSGTETETGTETDTDTGTDTDTDTTG